MKIALASLVMAREGDLRDLILELIQDLLVGDIALLVVLLDHETVFVADSTIFCGNKRATHSVRFANVAVYAFPPIATFAFFALPWHPLLAIGQRPA